MTSDAIAVQQCYAPTNLALPPTRASDSAKFTRTTAWLDVVLALLLLVLAFLLGSSPARNSDLWMHIGTGKLLVSGEYHFGFDPFAHTTTNAYWVNHGWVFDVFVYVLYTTLGGASLVVLKALLLVVIAGVLVRTGKVHGRLWASVVCAAVAVLAISRWLHVQPIAFSYLFLALTVLFLERRRRLHTATWTAYWPLLPGFVLWVNLDGWFLLGPLTVALYWLGGLLNGNRSGRRALGIAFLLSVAACVLNPHHIRAFELPWQLGLSEAGSVRRHDPQFRGQFLSPLASLYYRPDVGLNPAGLAYFVLILAGLLSFLGFAL